VPDDLDHPANEALCRYFKGRGRAGLPALARPDTKIIFGFAGGTHTYALRLPEDFRKEALRAGAARVRKYPRQPPFDLDVIGPEWVFCSWFKDEQRWCLSAYECASG
jgi:hypothetical protein